MAPVDGAAQGPLALGQIATDARQDGQALLEANEDGRRREHLDAGRGQLDRQGEAVEPRADRRDGCGVGCLQFEVGADVVRPLDEQHHRIDPGELLQRRQPPRIRKRERRDGILLLTPHPERLPAGHDDHEPRCRAQEVAHERGPIQDLLEVVEHEQEAQVGQVRLERHPDRPSRVLAHPESAGDSPRDQLGIVDRGQVDEESAAGEPWPQDLGDAQAQARLAGATGSEQGDQA